mmetsp:Transcript_38188/g.121635  ORF Transcript_38188/g.121635 Transcript_38188/m.121635 type:complete len:438 (+) Transcript_38188:150-1463(+)
MTRLLAARGGSQDVAKPEAGPMRNNFTEDSAQGSRRVVHRRHSDGIMEMGRMSFSHVPKQDGNTYMGTTQRSCITGEIFVASRYNWPSFDLADLFTREHIHGYLRQFLEDNYLFFPVPMPYRTWIYHEAFLDNKVSSINGNPEHAMVQDVLGTRCIDVDVAAGRWSPIMCYAPMVLILCLTGDMVGVGVGIVLVLFLWFMSVNMNTPVLYCYLRIATLPMRLAFGGILGLQWASYSAFAQFFAAMVLLGILLDLIRGDLQELLCFRMNCSYEIVKALPERVFICRRHGASHLEHRFGWRGRVAESITGLGAWNKDFYLIADINGMLAELRPVRMEDMLGIHAEQCEQPRILSFMGLKSFSFNCPTSGCLDVTTQAELTEVCKKFKQSLPPDSLLHGEEPDRCMGPDSSTSDFWSEAAQPKVQSPIGAAPAMVIETDF